MTSNLVPLADRNASRMMCQAIRHELHCPPGPSDHAPAEVLAQVARSLAQRAAAQGQVSAIKEAPDRIEDKTLPGAPESDDRPTHVSVSWKKPK
jgi:hypothetical protein